MTPELSASYAFCSRVARRSARNFYPSFLLLPAGRRRSMCALYAFSRQADDIADEPGEPAAKHAALTSWRLDLDAALGGGTPPGWPGWPALTDTVRNHDIPSRYLHEILDGVAMDVEPQAFETVEELRRYCRRVASAVGLCCIHIWGFRSENGRAEVLADATGQALQLTNIVRDVAEDARNGRVYLPKEDLDRFGVRPEDLSAAATGPALRELLAFEARRAYDDYERARDLAPLVDPVGRPVLNGLVGVYRELLDEIARRRFDVLTARISVPTRRKVTILLRALAGRFSTPAASAGPAPRPTAPR